MKTFLSLLVLCTAALPSLAQSDSTPFDLSTSVPAYNVVVDKSGDHLLEFLAQPFGSVLGPNLRVTITRTLEYATNYASDRMITLDVSASDVNDWYNLTMNVAPGTPTGAASGGDPSVGTKASGDPGSLGAKGAGLAGATGDIADEIMLENIALAHGRQVVTFQVDIKNVTETTDSNDRTFSVTYTIEEDTN